MILSANTTGSPVLSGRHLSKHYGSIVALDDASFDLWPGEVLGVVGDNGAGKSTLLNIMAGAHQQTSGQLLVDGETDVRMRSPLDARRHGIETVYQDLALAPDLTIASNMFLGREPVRGGLLGRLGVVDKKKMVRMAQEELDLLSVHVPSIRSECASLSGGQRQGVAIARAVSWSRRALLLDEPTAALGVQESGRVAEMITSVSSSGTAVVLISHNLPQVHEVCDRVLVMRRGRVATTLEKSQTTVEEVVAWITGAKSAG